MTNTIPTVAAQVELATRAHAALGGRVVIDGRSFRVVRWHYEIRFFGQAKFQGEIAPDAHVACLRSDLAVAQTLPGESQDRRLAAQCAALVASVLR